MKEKCSRHDICFVFAGVAMLCTLTWGRGFVNVVGTGALARQPKSHRATSISGTEKENYATGATTVTACGFLAIAGAVLSSRGKSAVTRRWRVGHDKMDHSKVRAAQLKIEWQVDPKTPEPGSQIALEAMIGHDVEIGDGKPWDPWGLSKLYDRNFDFDKTATWPHVQWLREAEIKHGRICMLAFIGMVVPQWWQIPGYPQEPDWTKALDLCYQDPLAKLGMGQISVFAMLVEGRWAGIDSWIGQMDREPGDFGFDPLRITRTPGFDLRTKQLRELKNGRLAMIGVASMAANHAIPGSVPFLTGAF